MAIKIPRNLGVGVDIEETRRFKNLTLFKDRIFLNKIYTKNELAYCLKKANPGLHLAGRFVAKEAVFKALVAIGKGQGIPLKKIEILANIDGAPQVRFRSLKGNELDINLSISHCGSRAIAFALIINYEKFKKKSHSK